VQFVDDARTLINGGNLVIGWFSSKNVSGGSTLRSIFLFTCNFEVNLITHLGVLALFSSNL
jgi:hypothetical protein